jgi:hypothetical protein
LTVTDGDGSSQRSQRVFTGNPFTDDGPPMIRLEKEERSGNHGAEDQRGVTSNK